MNTNRNFAGRRQAGAPHVSDIEIARRAVANAIDQSRKQHRQVRTSTDPQYKVEEANATIGRLTRGRAAVQNFRQVALNTLRELNEAHEAQIGHWRTLLTIATREQDARQIIVQQVDNFDQEFDAILPPRQPAGQVNQERQAERQQAAQARAQQQQAARREEEANQALDEGLERIALAERNFVVNADLALPDYDEQLMN